ncbi:MAG TPA: pitrilysin family protein [Bacteroidia bacterium]|nr:pitrilysin family protein [Bacteroidia bacterium]
METEIKLDRKTMPSLAKQSKIDIAHAIEGKLPNGIPLYSVNAGTQDVVKVELIFRAGGTSQQNAPLVADTTNALLEEGTKNKSSEEIASMLDYYGSFLETASYNDYATVSIYSLGKHIAKVMPLLEELIKEPSFPQSELDVYITNKKQRFLVDDKKVRSVAARNFPALLFGDAHPYGHATKIEEYDALQRTQLETFHKQHYSPTGCAIIVSGKVKDPLMNLISDHFGNANWKGEQAAEIKKVAIQPSAEKKNFIPRDKAMQSAIRMGKQLFLKSHPDSIPFQILNTILGGYFGSRLMSNIREDKGYTYGISSSMVFLKDAGYFQVSSEVGSDVCDKALVEIYKELDRLCNEPVPQDELQLVKNYARGNFLRSMDGPFALAERFKHIWLHGLDYSYYEKYINTLSEITSAQLIETARKYLQKDSIYELVVGAKKA